MTNYCERCKREIEAANRADATIESEGSEYPPAFSETEDVIEVWLETNRLVSMHMTHRDRSLWDQCVRAYGGDACRWYIDRVPCARAGHITNKINSDAAREEGYFAGLRHRKLRAEAMGDE